VALSRYSETLIMMFRFHTLAVITSLICFSLVLAWFFAPTLLTGLLGIPYTYDVGLIGRRAGALFLALGLTFYLARNVEPSPARSAIGVGMAMGCLLLAALGIFEYLSGHAGAGVWLAVVVELIVALLLLISVCTER
jgi:hypothetical protein